MGKIFYAARGHEWKRINKGAKKKVEKVLLGWNSRFGNFRSFYVSSFTFESKEHGRVLFVRSICASKCDSAMDNCRCNLLVWKEKRRETVIGLLQVWSLKFGVKVMAKQKARLFKFVNFYI